MFEKVKKNIINIPGKRTKRKLLVFESDDWGSIRIPTIETREFLLKKGYISDADPFSTLDTLESKEDLEKLFEVLSQFKDSNHNPPIITANTIIGNPDFKKIKESDFKAYFFEPFTRTYFNCFNSNDVFDVFKQGIRSGYFYPQFHGREHLNVPFWLKLLQVNNQAFVDAFDLNCFSVDYINSSNGRSNLMASYDYKNENDFLFIKESISQGLEQFETIFGFASKSFIAPCYVWDNEIEKVFSDNGVNGIQGSRFQNIPLRAKSEYKKKFHYTGQINKFGQMYFQRNGLFEPSLNKDIDWIDKCMESIEIAFKWNKPAIIGSHRINFVGGLDRYNSDNNLMLLEELFRRIIKKWPEIEFVTTSDLLTEL